MTGELSFRANYKDGKEHGLSEHFHLNGEPYIRFNYAHGEKHGVEEHFYQNGQLRYRFHYSRGKLEGEVVAYYENGQLEYRKSYRRNLEHGRDEGYHKNGELWHKTVWEKGRYKEGARYRYFYPDGSLESERFTKNYTDYYIKHCHHKNGTLIEPGSAYGNEVNGRREGDWLFTDDNGEPTKIVSYKKGEKTKTLWRKPGYRTKRLIKSILKRL